MHGIAIEVAYEVGEVWSFPTRSARRCRQASADAITFIDGCSVRRHGPTTPGGRAAGVQFSKTMTQDWTTAHI